MFYLCFLKSPFGLNPVLHNAPEQTGPFLLHVHTHTHTHTHWENKHSQREQTHDVKLKCSSCSRTEQNHLMDIFFIPSEKHLIKWGHYLPAWTEKLICSWLMHFPLQNFTWLCHQQAWHKDDLMMCKARGFSLSSVGSMLYSCYMISLHYMFISVSPIIHHVKLNSLFAFMNLLRSNFDF